MRNPHHRLAWTAAVLGVAGLVMYGCGSGLQAPSAPTLESVGRMTAPIEPDKVTSASDCGPASAFDPANFTHSTRVDNRWYPLVPGTRLVLEGRADRGGGILPHQVVFVVTDLVKVIDGVRCVVLWDRDFSDGELVEAELAFHTQDDAGNVWNLGEYPEEYEAGEFLGAPNTWISGIGSAEGGILVPGSPRVGDKFLQGYVPEIQFLDCAKVHKMGESTCVPTGCYSDVLLIAERSPLEPGSGTQLKYYAPGVGNVQIGAVGDKENETLVMVERRPLTTRELSEARREALRLERRAYEVSPAYRLTEPMQ